MNGRNTTVATVDMATVLAPAEWGDSAEIKGLARRLQTLMPGDLSQQQALLLAQYSTAMDANPFRGDIYAFEYKGKIVLVEGYKLLVRWARRQCNYSDRYVPITGLPEGAIGFTCHILRDDAKDALKMFIDCGATLQEAYGMAGQSASGVVTRQDMVDRNSKPIAPPKGWTWEDVARKRALKNAINLAYGAPSPREIAAMTWMVDGTETRPEDWVGDTGESQAVRELTAQANAKDRERQARIDDVTPAEALAELFDSPPEPADDAAFCCVDCGEPVKPYTANGKTWSVSQLVDMGAQLRVDPGARCGACLKKHKEQAINGKAEPVQEALPGA